MARILIVDDSTAMRIKMKSILTQEGHTIVSEAANGIAAYREFALHLPDLVTMDVTMPLLDGIDAVKNIIDDFPGAKIIMVSAISQKHAIFMALNNGAMNYIIKPIDPVKVIEVVNKVLANDENSSVNPLFNISCAKNSVEIEQKHFSFKTKDGILIMNLSKGITCDEIKSLNSSIQELLTSEHRKVVLNFGNLESIDNAVLKDLFTIIDFFKNTKKEIRLVAGNETFRVLLKYRRLDLQDQIFSSLNYVVF